jgi:hypothetical protein
MNMSAYFAMRIMKKYDESGIDAAQTYYNQMFSISTYKQFQEETDAILIAEGYGEVIPVVA